MAPFPRGGHGQSKNRGTMLTVLAGVCALTILQNVSMLGWGAGGGSTARIEPAGASDVVSVAVVSPLEGPPAPAGVPPPVPAAPTITPTKVHSPSSVSPPVAKETAGTAATPAQAVVAPVVGKALGGARASSPRPQEFQKVAAVNRTGGCISNNVAMIPSCYGETDDEPTPCTGRGRVGNTPVCVYVTVRCQPSHCMRPPPTHTRRALG
jgi:hypothetical protein